MGRAPVLRSLFSNLRSAGYQWPPQTPDRLLAFRKDPAALRPLVRWLGLGLPVERDELFYDDLETSTYESLTKIGLVKDDRITMAISGSGDPYIVHDHWPPKHGVAGGYLHYAAESEWLAREIGRDLRGIFGKRVLDLGCSSGALAFACAGAASQVLGLDISTRAIEWARDTAEACGFRRAKFETATIGQAGADNLVGQHHWDLVVMNPPMVIPSKEGAYAHRDGGNLGIEVPLAFLTFSARHLERGGEVYTLVTNPIVGGRSMFFERFDRKYWQVLEKKCLHPRFNHAVARKQGYADAGVERVELWFLHLKKEAQ